MNGNAYLHKVFVLLHPVCKYPAMLFNTSDFKMKCTISNKKEQNKHILPYLLQPIQTLFGIQKHDNKFCNIASTCLQNTVFSLPADCVQSLKGIQVRNLNQPTTGAG